ncbi:MAG: hypothetical protein FWF77_00330 [Defluviitaleaceae bacterium]|nr:hypothetical protein [Defluviitaleaceae bacterium]
MSKLTRSLEAGSNFLAHKKNESASVTRRLVFPCRISAPYSALHNIKPALLRAHQGFQTRKSMACFFLCVKLFQIEAVCVVATRPKTPVKSR